MMSDYEVEMANDSSMEFFVLFRGPKGTPYEGGTWKVHVELPDQVCLTVPISSFLHFLF
jgi:ubiquitin-conjugating enzyme E2 H